MHHAVELAELRQLAKKLSVIGLRAIDDALKSAQQKQAAQNAKAARAHERQSLGVTDYPGRGDH